MPNFTDVPTGWTVDRYAPAGFANVGTFEGRDGVLGITADSTGSPSARGEAYSSSFYSLQGRIHNLSGGIGDTLTASLWVPSSWEDRQNGARFAGMWVRMASTSNVISYTGIGFGNQSYESGTYPNYSGHILVYDGAVGSSPAGWRPTDVPVLYDAWNEFRITLTSNSFVLSINGAAAYVASTIFNATRFDSVLIEIRNYYDMASTIPAVANDYTAYWSAPEPATMGILMLGLLGSRLARRRRAGR